MFHCLSSVANRKVYILLSKKKKKKHLYCVEIKKIGISLECAHWSLESNRDSLKN